MHQNPSGILFTEMKPTFEEFKCKNCGGKELDKKANVLIVVLNT